MIRRSARKKSLPKKFSKLRLGILTLGLVFFLIVFGKVLGFIASLSGPLAPDSQEQKTYNWNDKGLLNIAVRGDQVYLFSFNPSAKEVTLLKIPDDTYLNVPLGFGLWPARSVYDLGQGEKPPMGGKLLKETLSNTLGVGVDDYLILNNRLSEKPLIEEVKNLKENPLEIFNLISDSKTNLSMQELWGLTMALRGVRSDKITEVNLGDSNLTVSRLLPDGTRVLAFDLMQMDEFIETQLTDALLKDEELNVGIFNATSHPQMAEKAARLITNMGGRVVFTTNSQKQLQQSIVLGKSSYTKTRLSSFFAPQCLNSTPIYKKIFSQVDPCSCKDCDSDISRAEINVFIGEDFYQKQVQK